jgi:hypothetical protein
LGWDSKVESFFKSVGRERYLVQGDAGPLDIADCVTAAIAEGIDPSVHAYQLEQARNGIGQLLDKLSVALPGPASRVRSQVY